jgi:hypothetical protein
MILGPDIGKLLQTHSTNPREMYNLGKSINEVDIASINKTIVAKLNSNFWTPDLYTTKGGSNQFYKLGQDFLNNLKEYKAIAAGGFILQACLGETWGDLDIDLYVHTSDAPKLLAKIIPSHPINDHRKVGLFQSQNYHNSFMHRNSVEYLIMYGSVQIMCIKDDVFLDDVIGSFDLDICQVSFDGDEIRLHNVELDSIMNKKGKLNPEYYNMFNYKLIKRIVKYRNRGFDIDCDVNRGLTSSLTLKENMDELSPSDFEKEACKKILYAEALKGSEILSNTDTLQKCFGVDVSNRKNIPIRDYMYRTALNFIEKFAEYEQLRTPRGFKLFFETFKPSVKDVGIFVLHFDYILGHVKFLDPYRKYITSDNIKHYIKYMKRSHYGSKPEIQNYKLTPGTPFAEFLQASVSNIEIDGSSLPGLYYNNRAYKNAKVVGRKKKMETLLPVLLEVYQPVEIGASVLASIRGTILPKECKKTYLLWDTKNICKDLLSKSLFSSIFGLGDGFEFETYYLETLDSNYLIVHKDIDVKVLCAIWPTPPCIKFGETFYISRELTREYNPSREYILSCNWYRNIKKSFVRNEVMIMKAMGFKLRLSQGYSVGTYFKSLDTIRFSKDIGQGLVSDEDGENKIGNTIFTPIEVSEMWDSKVVDQCNTGNRLIKELLSRFRLCDMKLDETVGKSMMKQRGAFISGKIEEQIYSEDIAIDTYKFLNLNFLGSEPITLNNFPFTGLTSTITPEEEMTTTGYEEVKEIQRVKIEKIQEENDRKREARRSRRPIETWDQMRVREAREDMELDRRDQTMKDLKQVLADLE